MSVRIEFVQATARHLLSAERTWAQVPRVGESVDLTQTRDTDPASDADTLPSGEVARVLWWSDGSAKVSLRPR